MLGDITNKPCMEISYTHDNLISIGELSINRKINPDDTFDVELFLSTVISFLKRNSDNLYVDNSFLKCNHNEQPSASTPTV